MSDTETRPLSPRRRFVIIGVVAAALVVVLAAVLIGSKLAADDAAKNEAVAALTVANATLDTLAKNDGRAEYDATIDAARAYSKTAVYELTYMTGNLDAATVTAFADSVTALDAAISSSAPGDEVQPEPFEAADDTTEAYAAATAEADAAIAAATADIALTTSATVDLETAIVASDAALIAVADTVPAAAAALIASNPEWDNWHINFVNESAASVQDYLDRRLITVAGFADEAGTELVAHIAEELLFTTYLTTRLSQFAILVKSYRV